MQPHTKYGTHLSRCDPHEISEITEVPNLLGAPFSWLRKLV